MRNLALFPLALAVALAAGCAVVAGDESGASSAAGIPPRAPTGLTAEPVTSSRILLTWNDESDDETAFRVERGLSPSGAYTVVATVPADTIFYYDDGYDPDTVQCYRVRAVSLLGVSNPTNVATRCGTVALVGLGGVRLLEPGDWWRYVLEVEQQPGYAISAWYTSAVLASTDRSPFADTQVSILRVENSSIWRDSQGSVVDTESAVDHVFFLQDQDGAIFGYGSVFLADDGTPFESWWISSPPFRNLQLLSPVRSGQGWAYAYTQEREEDAATDRVDGEVHVTGTRAVCTGVGSLEAYVFSYQTTTTKGEGEPGCSGTFRQQDAGEEWYVPGLGRVGAAVDSTQTCDGLPFGEPSRLEMVLEATSVPY